MSKQPRRRAPNYDRKLARRITLEDGTKLATLRDAANLFAERFATVKSLAVARNRDRAADRRRRELRRDKVKAATDAIERVLRPAAALTEQAI